MESEARLKEELRRKESDIEHCKRCISSIQDSAEKNSHTPKEGEIQACTRKISHLEGKIIELENEKADLQTIYRAKEILCGNHSMTMKQK